MKVVASKEIKKSGSSLVVNLTKELKMIEVEEGDFVKVTVEKA